MKKYKIVACSIPHYKNVEVPFDFTGVNVQDKINVFGEELTVSQIGTIISAHNENSVFTLQEVVEVEIPDKVKEILNG